MNIKNQAVSRRRFIKMAAIAAAALPAGSALLAACGDTATSAPAAATTGAAGAATTTSAAGAATTTTAATTSAAANTTAATTSAAASTAAATTGAAATGAATTSAAATGAATTAPAAGGATTTQASVDTVPAPTVPNAAAAKKYSGTTITFNGDSVGSGTPIDKAMAAQFTKDTGIIVNVVPHPSSSDDYYASLQRIFQGQSGEIDVMMLDVIWPGAFAQYLADLTSAFTTEAKGISQGAIQNDTVNGKLVAMPYFGDFGMLYYRKDLLQKYGFSNPPQTWDELQTQAQKVIDGEKASNPNFVGFTWQGKAYEGLTCDALEWIASSGGGTIVDSSGKVTINNDAAAKALTRAKGWVGTISPSGITSYQEDQSLQPFLAGNALFMRNWPYAYAQGQDPKASKIVGKFDAAPLPHDQGQKSVGTLGGWQIGVNKFSKNQAAAIEFARYITSPEIAKYRAIVGSYVPLVTSVLTDPDVVKAEPFLATTADVVRVARPSTAAGTSYNQISGDFYQGVSQVLAGQDPKSVLGNVQNRIQTALK